LIDDASFSAIRLCGLLVIIAAALRVGRSSTLNNKNYINHIFYTLFFLKKKNYKGLISAADLFLAFFGLLNGL
jgi:hypothetical protein